MRRLLLATAATGLAASAGLAQLTQYTAPGSLAVAAVPLKEQVEKSMEEARWRLGPLRLSPTFGLRDVTYYNNLYGSVEDEVSDLSASLAAGLRAYLPVGPKSVLVARAVPEYVWWKDRAEQRRLVGRYGAGALVYLARFTLEAMVERVEEQGFVSSESETPFIQRTDSGSVSVEVPVLERLSLFGRGSRARYRFPDDEEHGGLAVLARDEDTAAAGVRYVFSERLGIGLGAQRTRASFLDEVVDRSNTGTSTFLELTGKLRRVDVRAQVYDMKVEPEEGAQLTAFDGTTGRVTLTFRLGRRLDWSVYGGRNLVYSLLSGADYYVEDVYGAAVVFPLGWRLSGRLFAERGSNDYEGTAARPAADRSYEGLVLTIPVLRRSSVLLQVDHGNLQGVGETADRKVWRVRTAVALGGSSWGW